MKILPALCWAAVLLAQTGNFLEQADEAFRGGDLDRAAALAADAAKSDPNAVHAYMILGAVAAQRGQWDNANRQFQRVIRLDPANPYGYFYLGQASLYQQNWDRAIQHFQSARERGYPDRQRLTIELAFALNEAGRSQEALDNLRELPAPVPDALAAQYHATIALALVKLNQPPTVIESIRKAIDLDDSKPEYWTLLISTLIDIDRTTSALAEAIRAQKRFPDDPDIQFLFGLTSYYVTESPLSELALRNLREAEPQGPRVLLVEGLLHRKLGRTEEALQAFRQAATQGVRNAHLLLGILLRESGDSAGAEREYRAAERENPLNGQTLLELGKLLLARGELEEALSRLERAEYLMPDSSSVHYQLGVLYGRLDQKEKAAQHLHRYRELEARNAELQR